MKLLYAYPIIIGLFAIACDFDGYTFVSADAGDTPTDSNIDQDSVSVNLSDTLGVSDTGTPVDDSAVAESMATDTSPGTDTIADTGSVTVSSDINTMTSDTGTEATEPVPAGSVSDIDTDTASDTAIETLSNGNSQNDSSTGVDSDSAIDTARLDVGDICSDSSQCKLGSCQNATDETSVCCTASCDDACKQCSPSGETCDNLLDDDACGVIVCPEDTPCRDYPDITTQNRCVSGECGSGNDVCTFMPINEGETCADGYRCDSSGDCSIVKQSLGTECSENVECMSGHCVDEVCCEDACESVDCSLVETDCWTSTSITENRCDSFGHCKGLDDCPRTSFLPAGTPCERADYDHRICDGSGECKEPVVRCGSGSCTTGGTGNTCCLSAEGAGVTSPTCQSSCEVRNQIPSYQALCDEHTDCNRSHLCCVTGGRYTFVTECKEPHLCNWADSSGGSFEVCKSPGTDTVLPCSQGTECTMTVPKYDGWLFCELP